MSKVTIDRELLERLLYSNSPARFDATEYNAARAELFAILANTSQQCEAVEVVGWRRLDRSYEMTAYPSVCAMWHGAGYPVQALYTHPADQVASGVAELKALLPALDDALEDLELHGRHSDQGCRKLKDWYRKAELITDRIDGAHCVAGQSAEPDAELVRQCISQELATWEGDFKGPVNTAMRCLQTRIDAELASLKGVEE